MARAGGMIVGSIKLDDSEIAIGEVPSPAFVYAPTACTPCAATASVRSLRRRVVER